MGNFRILLVEDDQLMMRVFEKQFRLNGLDTDIVTDGEAALTYLKTMTTPPSLVCLDIMLPKVSGIEILKFIRGNELTKTIPVIILSNVGSSDVIAEAKKLGVDGYFMKSEHDPQEIGDAVIKIITSKMGT
jgi:DNA-binding response OmpR family regulator